MIKPQSEYIEIPQYESRGDRGRRLQAGGHGAKFGRGNPLMGSPRHFLSWLHRAYHLVPARDSPQEALRPQPGRRDRHRESTNRCVRRSLQVNERTAGFRCRPDYVLYDQKHLCGNDEDSCIISPIGNGHWIAVDTAAQLVTSPHRREPMSMTELRLHLRGVYPEAGYSFTNSIW
jgi:hypothetical protein